MSEKLVVLGSGFAAFSLIKRLNVALYDTVVVSPRNHFLFTPLLPSTTVGTIEFRSIIEPVRSAGAGIRYLQASCESLDADASTIRCRAEEGEFTLPYDLLVIAVGSRSNTYGIPGVEEFALPLKDLADARAIRQRIIGCFERASMPNVSAEERKRLLHFVVVGGGPTGVEFAAEMHDFLIEDLARPFAALLDDCAITLLEAAAGILPAFDASLAEYTLRHFRRQRITVRTGAKVVALAKSGVRLSDGSEIPCEVIVWSTGVGAPPFVERLDFPKEKWRIVVDSFLRVKGEEKIFAAGDCATGEEMNYPATAQVAQQEGYYLARALNRRARGLPAIPFRYRHMGMLAYIGDNRALADLPTVKGKGFATWLFWRSAYLTKLVSTKNKILVVFDWLKAFLFGRDISRF